MPPVSSWLLLTSCCPPPRAQAYRRLALLKHPDKCKSKDAAAVAAAAAAFAELQKAYAVLTDKDARAALDGLLAARAARSARTVVHSEKRRRMMEELERRERTTEAARGAEEAARAKLGQEIARLRRAAAEREAAAQAQRRAAAAAPAAPSGQGAAAGGGAVLSDGGGGISVETQERLLRTLKVSWSRKVRRGWGAGCPSTHHTNTLSVATVALWRCRRRRVQSPHPPLFPPLHRMGSTLAQTCGRRLGRMGAWRTWW